MELFQALCLALIQGLTEFLPISSSAHLILPAQILGWRDQGLSFDVAVHAGTLMAVVLYYRADLWRMSRAVFIADSGLSAERREVLILVLATLPAVVVGLLLSDFIDAHLRSTSVIATTTLVFALLLWLAYVKRGMSGTDAQPVQSIRDGLVIGVAQVLALIPGTSRSGITITAGLMLGYPLNSAARFSFLLSIPVILGALVLMLVKQSDELMHGGMGLVMAVSTLTAGVAAYLTIAFFVRIVERVGMLPFVAYRLALGAVLLLFFV